MSDTVSEATNPEFGTTQVDTAVSQDADDASDLLLGPDSDQSPVLSVVMPTLNEEEGVVVCIGKIKRAISELGITAEIIISDSSDDRTPAIARELGAIVVEPDRMGYGYAYRYAFARARGDYIAIGDADVTYDFESLPKILEPVREGDADIVLGSRLDGTIKSGAMPALHQYVGNPLLTRVLNVLYDADISDAHSGFRVLSRDALDTLDLTSDGMEFASEMLMEASTKGLRIEEVPIVYHERKGDATLHSFRDGWRHVRFMVGNAPGYVFFRLGTVFTVVGLVLPALSVADLQIGPFSPGLVTTVGAGLAAITGIQFWALAEFSTNTKTGSSVPSDPLTRLVRTNVRRRHGKRVGVGLCALGLAYLGYRATLWATTGYTAIPSVQTTVVALTTLVLGLQLVSSSFLLDALGETA
ncbi:glycosyltransferase family 2 protein [Haloarcula onubensis]|uniref:Glycosyltransferase family 2 protein n=1 Tax=Haloarcula onubensis TaxID=2950539 RepID=A0ABU2FV70_9EURY|nr:glycosyltransferase family 2 protein [Halomicroarcula sp. S3CR25-11]MDS0284664.1 glycosyltransferase family 2 protein [Halomicroarcula sp. S3CR25-11]